MNAALAFLSRQLKSLSVTWSSPFLSDDVLRIARESVGRDKLYITPITPWLAACMKQPN